MIVPVILIVLAAVMFFSAIAAIYTKNLVASVILSGAVSLMASIVFLLVGAPDVAMTEAAIGSALTTVVFLFALSRMRGNREVDRD